MDIDLVMSGSGTRFPVFIGGLKAIEEKCTIKRVAGTSGGAIIAACIASGLKSKDMMDKIFNVNFKEFKDHNFFSFFTNYGVYKGKRFEEFIDEITEGRTFSEADVDIHIVATDLLSRKRFLFNKELTPEAKISKAVRCSMSVPLVFAYQLYQNKILVDGLASSNYFIDIFDDETRPTVGFRVGTRENIPRSQHFNLIEYFYYLIESLMLSVEREHIEDAYWAKTIHMDASKYSSLDFGLTNKEKQDMINIGYEAAKNNCEDVL